MLYVSASKRNRTPLPLSAVASTEAPRGVSVRAGSRCHLNKRPCYPATCGSNALPYYPVMCDSNKLPYYPVCCGSRISPCHPVTCGSYIHCHITLLFVGQVASRLVQKSIDGVKNLLGVSHLPSIPYSKHALNTPIINPTPIERLG